MALAWSGGKDSSLALAALQNDPAFQPVALVTTITGDYDRISMHGVRRSVLDAQVKELALPLFEAIIPPEASNAIYEEALTLALKMVRSQWPDLQHVFNVVIDQLGIDPISGRICPNGLGRQKEAENYLPYLGLQLCKPSLFLYLYKLLVSFQSLLPDDLGNQSAAPEKLVLGLVIIMLIVCTRGEGV